MCALLVKQSFGVKVIFCQSLNIPSELSSLILSWIRSQSSRFETNVKPLRLHATPDNGWCGEATVNDIATIDLHTNFTSNKEVLACIYGLLYCFVLKNAYKMNSAHGMQTFGIALLIALIVFLLVLSVQDVLGDKWFYFEPVTPLRVCGGRMSY